MPDELYGGSIESFAGSMAEEIELAFDAVLAENDKDPVRDSDREGLQLLYIAIARGVINHLKKNQSAFAVSVNGTNPASGFPNINVRPSP